MFNRHFQDYDTLDESEREFFQDLTRLLNREGAWSFDIIASGGAYDSEFHFGIGNGKGDEVFGWTDIFVKDVDRYKSFYSHFARVMKEQFGIESDNGKYHAYDDPKIWRRIIPLEGDVNSVMLRVAWSVMLWNDRRLLIAKTIADCINEGILGKNEAPLPESLHVKSIGYEGYGIPDLQVIQSEEGAMAKGRGDACPIAKARGPETKIFC